jgi:hypothetical protein
MMDRYCLPAARALLLCAIGAASAAESESRWNFRVYLDQDLIGYHDFTLTPKGDARELQSTAHFVAKFLFFTAYHYHHQATEDWRGDCLSRLDSHSDDDGKLLDVHASYALADCAMTFAYWNPAILRRTHLINPETGDDVPVTISLIGEQDIQVRNAPVAARHYHLQGRKLDIDLWYSTEGNWLALESAVENGRHVRYVLN